MYKHTHTLSGHFVTKHKPTNYLNVRSGSKPWNIKNNVRNNNNANENNSGNSVKGAAAAAHKTTIYDDSFKTSRERLEVAKHNEAYKLVSEPWPSGNAKIAAISDAKLIANNNNLEENAELTALVSFPGSGNTWLRYLMQQATGKCRFLNY